MTKKPALLAALIISLGLYYFIGFETVRTNATQVISLYAGLFLLYFLILRISKQVEHFATLVTFGFVIRIAFLFVLPFLSDDFFRFVWDGILVSTGNNPYLHTPNELIAGNYDAFFDQLNSKDYYSVYPPLLQYVFWIAVKLFPESPQGAIATMKFFVLLAEAGSLYFLLKLGKQFGFGDRSALIYFLNPLVIIELSGNLHFDAFLICFLLGAVWFGSKSKLIPSAGLLGLAVAAKINPLMTFPFFIRRWGINRSIIYFFLAIAIAAVTIIPFANTEAFSNFGESLQLYFQSFEFNASFYYLSKYIVGQDYALVLGKVFPMVIVIVILAVTFRHKRSDWKSLPILILFAFTVYYLCARVIHPWYLTTLVAFAALTTYRYAILWSFLIPFTYLTYATDQYIENIAVIWIEYSLVMGLAILEWTTDGYKRTLEDILWENSFFKKLYSNSIPSRVKIKRDRIASRLQSGEKIIDIGTGNGGLCNSLMKLGHDVTPVDVKDRSFFKNVKPNVYDGVKLPYAEDEFDVALLITVLHHTPDPRAILKEALRVAPRVVIMEDIYRNPVQKHLTFFTDSLVNLEFADHPHTNKDDDGWRQLFDELGLRLVSREDFRTLLFYRQVIYAVGR